MKTTISPAATKSKTDTRLVEALQLVLADSYALTALSHDAHWNVEGPAFFALHKAFEEHYEHLFKAVDEIAERIRALGHYAQGGLNRLGRQAGMEEFNAPLSQKDYVAALIVAHEKTVDDAARARDLAGEFEDLETQDRMIGRIQEHQKVVWMLKSFLK